MNIGNLKFITDQILSYVQKNKGKSINVPGDLRGYPVPNTVTGHAVCAFPSKYPRPQKVHICVQEWISLKETRYLYFKFELLFNSNNFNRTIPLDVRWSPLEYQTNNRGRKALPKRCSYTKHGKIDVPRDERKNLSENYRIYYSNEPRC